MPPTIPRSSEARRRSRLLSILALSAATACSSPLEPETLAGEYENRALVGQTVTSAYGPQVRVAYAGVTIQPGQVRKFIVYEEPIIVGGGSVGGEEVLMHYTIDGRRIVTSGGGCPIDVFCLSIAPGPDPADFLVFGDHLVELGANGAEAATYTKRGPRAIPLEASVH